MLDLFMPMLLGMLGIKFYRCLYVCPSVSTFHIWFPLKCLKFPLNKSFQIYTQCQDRDKSFLWPTDFLFFKQNVWNEMCQACSKQLGYFEYYIGSFLFFHQWALSLGSEVIKGRARQSLYHFFCSGVIPLFI
jgi:hypothetical protein